MKTPPNAGRYYKKTKSVIHLIYDISSVLFVLMSFDNLFKAKTWRVIKPWQISTLVERLPRMLKTLKRHKRYGL